MSTTQQYPLHFRENELGMLFNSIIDGDSVSLVGVGSVGKTHMLQHIAQQEGVQNHLLEHMNQSKMRHENILFVMADANFCLDLTAFQADSAVRIPQNWAGFELLVRSLCQSCRDEKRFGSDLPRTLQEIYQMICTEDLNGAWRAPLHLQSAVESIFKSNNRIHRIVFLLDEFEQLLSIYP